MTTWHPQHLKLYSYSKPFGQVKQAQEYIAGNTQGGYVKSDNELHNWCKHSTYVWRNNYIIILYTPEINLTLHTHTSYIFLLNTQHSKTTNILHTPACINKYEMHTNYPIHYRTQLPGKINRLIQTASIDTVKDSQCFTKYITY